jgi:hypothetical protein
VALASPSRAWAVGYYEGSAKNQTLIEAWNGSSWVQQPSPAPGGPAGPSYLFGASATSASDAWAVGEYLPEGASGFHGLIEHWNGTTWKQVPILNPGFKTILLGVAATSASNAWAVGHYIPRGFSVAHTLIEHWNGTAWTQVPSPNLGYKSILQGVAATSASDAWAVGYSFILHDLTYQTLIEHWNGTTWTQVASPNPGPANNLQGVAATSASNAWAVGYYSLNGAQRTLIEHWNGSTWKQVPSPSPGSAGNKMGAVSAISASNAWAVGDYSHFHGPSIVYDTLIEAWNGTTWKAVPSPNPGTSSNYLFGVAATSASNVWAVGAYNGTGLQTLALHCS